MLDGHYADERLEKTPTRSADDDWLEGLSMGMSTKGFVACSACSNVFPGSPGKKCRCGGKGVSLKAGSKNKFGARKVTIGGHAFDSLKEGRRFQVLKAMQQAGEIADLELQPEFPLIVNGILCGRYRADFRYSWVATGVIVVEDTKSKATKTEAYRLRKRLVEALYAVKILET